MAVRKRRTAWDILTKMAALTVRTRFEPVRTGSKQKQNERFARDFLQNTASDPVRNKRMAVQKRQTAWDIITKSAVLMVQTRFETMGCRFENGKPRGTSSQKPLFSLFELGSKPKDGGSKTANRVRHLRKSRCLHGSNALPTPADPWPIRARN